MFTKVSDAGLGTGDGGAKEKMGSRKCEVVLMITGIGSAEWCCCAVRGEFSVMNKAAAGFFVLAVKVSC